MMWPLYFKNTNSVTVVFVIITVHLGPRSWVSDGHALHQVIRRRLHVDRLTVAAKGVFALGEGDLIEKWGWSRGFMSHDDDVGCVALHL